MPSPSPTLSRSPLTPNRSYLLRSAVGTAHPQPAKSSSRLACTLCVRPHDETPHHAPTPILRAVRLRSRWWMRARPPAPPCHCRRCNCRRGRSRRRCCRRRAQDAAGGIGGCDAIAHGRACRGRRTLHICGWRHPAAHARQTPALSARLAWRRAAETMDASPTTVELQPLVPHPPGRRSGRPRRNRASRRRRDSRRFWRR